MAKKKTSKPTADGPSTTNTTTTPSWLHDGLPLPRLIVLDLDYTLWPFYSDIHISPPIRLIPNSNPPTLADRNGEHFALYPDAPHILRLISSLPNTRLAVASKSPVADLCREVLKLLRLPPPVDGNEKGPKKTIDAFDGG